MILPPMIRLESPRGSRQIPSGICLYTNPLSSILPNRHGSDESNAMVSSTAKFPLARAAIPAHADAERRATLVLRAAREAQSGIASLVFAFLGISGT